MKRLLRTFRGDVDGKVINEYSNGSVVIEEDDSNKEDKKKR